MAKPGEDEKRNFEKRLTELHSKWDEPESLDGDESEDDVDEERLEELKCLAESK